MARRKGTVKWFSDGKGYGFITPEDGEDLFVHHTSIDGSGYRTLAEGEEVEFEVMDETEGPKAQNVQRLNPPEPPRRQRAIQSPSDHRMA